MGMAQLSRRASVPYDSVAKYCKGSVLNPRGQIMDQLAAALGVSASYLRYGEEDANVAPAFKTPVKADAASEPQLTNVQSNMADVAWDAAGRIDEDVFGGRCVPKEKAQIYAIILEYLDGIASEVIAQNKIKEF